MVSQPTRIHSVNTASIAGVPKPFPTGETPVPVQDPVTEAKNPCKDDHLSYNGFDYILYEYESSADPCIRVTTTTEGRNKKTNAVPPIGTRKCRFCRLYY